MSSSLHKNKPWLSPVRWLASTSWSGPAQNSSPYTPPQPPHQLGHRWAEKLRHLAVWRLPVQLQLSPSGSPSSQVVGVWKRAMTFYGCAKESIFKAVENNHFGYWPERGNWGFWHLYFSTRVVCYILQGGHYSRPQHLFFQDFSIRLCCGVGVRVGVNPNPGRPCIHPRMVVDNRRISHWSGCCWLPLRPQSMHRNHMRCFN